MNPSQTSKLGGWHHFIGDGIVVLDEDFRVTELNRRFLELVPQRSAESAKEESDGQVFVGKELCSVLDPTHFRELCQVIEASRKRGGRSTSIVSWHGDRLLEIQVNPIHDEQGGAIGNCIVARDITEKYRGEEALHKSAVIVQLLQSVAISANEATSWKSVLSATLRNICGASELQCGQVFVPAKANPGEMKAANIWHAKPELGSVPGIEQELLQVSLGLELPLRVASSLQPIWIDDIQGDPKFVASGVPNRAGIKAAFAFPVRLEDRAVAVLEFFSTEALAPDHLLIEVSDNLGDQMARVLERERSLRIISEQQMKLAASSKLSALGEMAGGIAHEINNPLAAIHAMAGQLKELADENKVSTTLVAGIAEKIERTSMRIAKIIKGLRVLARDGQNDPLESIAVQSIIDDTLVFCGERLRVSGVEISFEDGCPSTRILCRSIQLSQVLLNLINNSFDAVLSRDSKWIRIKTVDQGEHIEINVIDSGNGIPYQVQERMFVPFFTTKDVGKGTGLGLSLSKAIMEGQGGGLYYDPTHENTRFVIRIPKAK